VETPGVVVVPGVVEVILGVVEVLGAVPVFVQPANNVVNTTNINNILFIFIQILLLI
jgi:hypothetical protein